jgi:putative Mn2+ efflux pump MntP
MNNQRLDKLLGWLSTGAIAITIGAFFLILGWLFPLLGAAPLQYRSTPVDTTAALAGGVILIVVGLFFVARAIIGKLRSDD